jgi:hypothetical protein
MAVWAENKKPRRRRDKLEVEVGTEKEVDNAILACAFVIRAAVLYLFRTLCLASFVAHWCKKIKVWARNQKTIVNLFEGTL